MSQKPIAMKAKVVAGYLLLFAAAACAVWIVYREILQSTVAETGLDTENRNVLRISDALAGLYSAEGVGRKALLDASDDSFRDYNQQIDSVLTVLDEVKRSSDPTTYAKFDSINLLLANKRQGMEELIAFRKKYNVENSFNQAVRRVSRVKDSLNRRVKPVEFRNDTQLRQFLNRVLTKRQRDSLSRMPVSNDTLTAAIERMLNKLIVRNNKLKYSLFEKEQKLLDENRRISDQIRTVVAELQDAIIRQYYQRIAESEQKVATTTEKIAWIGAGAFVVLLVMGWMLFRDITLSQRYRIKLEKLNAEKEDLLRSKTMLMATVTHDIQTPLGSVIGFSDLLKSTALNRKQEQYVDNIRNSSDYIVRLVNDLIDFSKLENDRISINEAPFQFKELISQTCLALLPNAQAKHIGLHQEIDPQLDGLFLSDPYRIKQILTNLVSNAVKFTQQGSVTVRANVVGDKIRLEVIDTGIGIAKENQKSVFREFTQAHSGIEKKFGGTGLGLTIAKRMLKLLGGSISVESEEGKGSTFTVILPNRPVAASPEFVSSEMIREDHSILSGKKVLVVDDDLMQLTLMRELFQHYPVRLRTENQASRVPELLADGSFDLVITDVQMPDVDGFELVRNIRSIKNMSIARIPVLGLSGKRDLSLEDFLSRGFTAMHPKPLHLEGLIAQMEAIFSGYPVKHPDLNAKAEAGEGIYNLETLNQFTHSDKESLHLILNTFLDSSRQNCRELLEAASMGDSQRLSSLAHKMLPMLKQLEAWNIVSALEVLEQPAVRIPKKELMVQVSGICRKMDELFEKLELELA